MRVLLRLHYCFQHPLVDEPVEIGRQYHFETEDTLTTDGALVVSFDIDLPINVRVLDHNNTALESQYFFRLFYISGETGATHFIDEDVVIARWVLCDRPVPEIVVDRLREDILIYYEDHWQADRRASV